MTLFLTASSFYSIFTQVPKTLNSTVALQVGFLKTLPRFFWIESVSVCCVSSCYSRQTDDQIRSLCGALAVFRQNLTGLLQLMAK